MVPITRLTRQSIYFILTNCLLSASPIKNAALLNFGGPVTTIGLRENPKPSFGRNTAISILSFAFSSCNSAMAYVPSGILPNSTRPALRAATRARWLFGSLLQSGKNFGLAVTQTSTLPLVLRRPVTLTSSVDVGTLALAAIPVKAAKPKVSAAHFVPKPEI